MRRILVALGLVAGCKYAGPATADGPAGDGGPADARADAGDAGPPGSCGATPDPALRLCLDFEEGDPAIARDGSGFANHAALTNVPSIARAPGLAAQCNGDCQIVIAESASLDLDPAPMTIAAWITADQSPAAGSRYGILDNNTQYSLFYQSDDTVTCTVFRNPSQSTTVRSTTFNQGEWTHIACVADGTMLTIYVDGAFSAGVTFGTSINTGSARGTRLAQDLRGDGSSGDTLVGALDDVRIWARALTPAQICAESGLGGC